ncbi:MAG: hypothetical protein JWM11_3792 [Planctomycetaceae bacterium]|nr:hypothetical protein [Planctomycetaceae bacterium]
MKHTSPDSILSRELLCFVRDLTPTINDFVARYGTDGAQLFHVLRKHEVVVQMGDRVRLNHRNLSPNGLRFVWGLRVYSLDSDVVVYIRSSSKGLPGHAEET